MWGGSVVFWVLPVPRLRRPHRRRPAVTSRSGWPRSNGSAPRVTRRRIGSISPSSRTRIRRSSGGLSSTSLRRLLIGSWRTFGPSTSLTFPRPARCFSPAGERLPTTSSSRSISPAKARGPRRPLLSWWRSIRLRLRWRWPYRSGQTRARTSIGSRTQRRRPGSDRPEGRGDRRRDHVVGRCPATGLVRHQDLRRRG